MVLKIGFKNWIGPGLRRSDIYAGMVLVLTGRKKIVHKLARTHRGGVERRGFLKDLQCS